MMNNIDEFLTCLTPDERGALFEITALAEIANKNVRVIQQECIAAHAALEYIKADYDIQEIIDDNISSPESYSPGSTIYQLPSNLNILGDLDLRNSRISKLQYSVEVAGSISANDRQLHASERTQIKWIIRGNYYYSIFSNPTRTAKNIHEMLWIL